MDKSKHLTDEELNQQESYLYSINKPSSKPKDRLYAFAFIWLYNLGVRPSELLLIKFKDVRIDEDRAFVSVTALKNSKNREVPLSKRASRLFQVLKLTWTLSHDGHQPDEDDLIFDFSYSNLVRVWKLFRTVKKPLKALRHTRAINIYKSKKDIHLTKYFLGHKNIKNTMIYVDYVESSKSLIEAVDC